MNPDKLSALEARIEELEVRWSFQEQLLGDLDAVVRGLGLRLDQVLGRMTELEGELRKDSGVANTLQDEVPPHY